MKCPNDQTEMEEGFIDTGYWLSGKKPSLSKVFAIGRKTIYAIAWRCSKCGKIELYTEMETK